jgi:hypothetical protein
LRLGTQRGSLLDAEQKRRADAILEACVFEEKEAAWEIESEERLRSA